MIWSVTVLVQIERQKAHDLIYASGSQQLERKPLFAGFIFMSKMNWLRYIILVHF